MEEPNYQEESIECIASCNLSNENTPVGIILNDTEKKVLTACNDKLYYFNLSEIIDSYTSFLEKEDGRISYYKSIHLGGNIRSISRNKQIRDHLRTNNMALFALNCRNYPVKVYNFDGELITSVYMRNQFEEIDEIYSLEFIYSEESSIILGGGKNCIHVYDYNSGKTLEYINFNSKECKIENSKCQKGIISCLSLKTSGIGSFSVFASGSFSKTIFLHDLSDLHSQIQLSDNNLNLNSVTELYWLDGSYDSKFMDYHLISGHRNSDYLYIWDVRKPNNILFKLDRENFGSNQRYNINLKYFEDELILTYGDSRGNLNIQKLKFNYDYNKFLQNVKQRQKIKLKSQSIPCVERFFDQKLLVTLSGERFTSCEKDQGCTFNVWKINTNTPS
ncbi:hypothetical protein CPHLJ_1g560 [Cryptosporidium parvum]|uniref:Uncharacterized protein n=1 Tax=Cryptosporidium parvum TaxID=5807 RepID=A0A7S7RHZ9_CRYPV|nr:Uncharacterized protein with WD40 [Cryptosporidium parvum]WKS75954.1 hypothetical protein CPCDC_1g560 [Cryptosporidium sp. 43IA8]WRK30447.1 WD40 protein [Cryptosporidium parvum]|eukprot:QOY43573.1 hypothetical protein CPATCC_000374 [Cryptosporidium parvum]